MTASMKDALAILTARLAGAKRRCENPTGKNAAYGDIAFEFASAAEGARLLYAKLGEIPDGMSLDRIDPRGPYSLDNLRYASPLLQTLNRSCILKRSRRYVVR